MNAESITAQPYKPDQAQEWKTFLNASGNGTLYHDLDFLAYHPADRFKTHHLMFYQGKKLLALLPAAVTDGKKLESPYGGSVGGFATHPHLSTKSALDLVKALQTYVKDTGLAGTEMRMGPNVYSGEPNDLMSFALMVNGFRLNKCALQYMIPLSKPGEQIPEKLFSSSKRYDVRTGLKNGLKPRETDASRLPDFIRLLQDTYARLGSKPTHTDKELEDLFRRAPKRMRLFLCSADNTEIAGVLVFMLNDRIASTFYICESSAHAKLCGPSVLVAHIAQTLADEGVQYLDLGPSASESHFNEGVVFFKEGLGAQGFCRDTWTWSADV
jgi:hypothetical protein